MSFMKHVASGTQFVHRYSFDEHGILFFLGTRGSKKIDEYVNPALSEMVIVNASEMMPDSEQSSAFISRKCMRCVTKPSAACWFSIDFVDKYINPSHYTLRHYSSFDTDCLRNWVIEGSMNGTRWLLLRQHVNDEALNYKAQAYTWSIDDYGCAFRKLRIRQTGPNSNGNYFLACSGFECYGALYKEEKHSDLQICFNQVYNDQQKKKQSSLAEFWGKLAKGQVGKYQFVYSYDFDENGILYFLGSEGGQKQWKNPSLSDEVSVCSSALVKDSTEISYFVGRTTVRLVTKPEDNAWMQVDFKDKLIQPSYYALKHYVSCDTECLRNWILQASNDGIHWVTVKKHEEDSSLSEKGAAHTWPVQSRGAYRIWRIKQTGLNSNKHKYLACSGIEFYGQLFLLKFEPLKFVSNPEECKEFTQKLKLAHRCIFEYNDDKKGAVYYCGTRGNTSNWENPATKKWIITNHSSLMHDSQPSDAICGRESVRCVTRPSEQQWFTINFRCLYIIPTHYSLRHYSTWNTEALRNWILEGSFDGNTWLILRTHRNDTSLDHRGAMATWEIKAKGAKYKCFRIKQVGANSNNHYYLACSGFEIYGDVYQVSYYYATYVISNWNRKYPELTRDLVLLVLKFIYVDNKGDISWSGDVPWQKHLSLKINDEKSIPKSIPSAGSCVRQEKQRLIHHLSSGKGYSFNYTKDFDTCGILYFLGTDWRISPWRNPAEDGVVYVTSSRLAHGSEKATAICGNKVVRCALMAEKNNWFMIDFKNLYIRVTHYTLRHYSSWDSEALRNWYLEASNDLKTFKIIKKHMKDKSLFGKGSTHTWSVDTKANERYRAFRIRQYGPNSNKHWYLALSGVEIYGELYFKPK
eukprot:406942_1